MLIIFALILLAAMGAALALGMASFVILAAALVFAAAMWFLLPWFSGLLSRLGSLRCFLLLSALCLAVKGGYILLDFYGTGCYPCRQALPELEELLEMYPGKLHVVGINREKKEDWIQYLDEVKPAGLQWNEAHAARNGLFKAYGVLPIPHYVLISPERKVVDSWTGYGEGSLKMRLRKWLK